MEKNFSLHSARIEILRDRGMEIPNSSEQKEILQNYNYYNLINAYKDPFLYSGSSLVERYKTGTKLSELEALLNFDTNLRLLFLKEILKIEEVIKNQIVQSFYTYHLHEEEDITKVEKSNLHRDSEYLRRKYYDLSDLITEADNDLAFGIIRTRIVSGNSRGRKVDRQITYDNYITTVYRTLGQQRKNKNESIKMYLEQHGYVPMWILMNVLTFGNVSHLFTLQKEVVQLDVITSLNLISPNHTSRNLDILNTSRILQILSLYRNICAHNERFYVTKTKVPIDDIYMKFGQKLPHHIDPLNGRRLNYAQQKKRLEARRGIYGLIYAISLFMNKKDLNMFVKEIRKELDNLEGKLNTITIQEIERMMGLNFNWHELVYE